MKKTTKGLLLTMSILSLGAFVGMSSQADYSMKYTHRLNASSEVVEAPEEFGFNNIKTFYKAVDSYFTIENLTEKLDFKGYASLEVYKDEYTGNGNVKGSYNVIYEILETTDSEEFTYYATTIVVQENIPLCNYFVFEDVLHVDTNIQERIDEEGLTDVLLASGLVTSETATVSYTDEKLVLTSEEILPGDYDLVANVRSSDGTNENIEIKLNVSDEESGVVIDSRPTKFQSFVNWLKGIWKGICDGAVWLWDHTIGAVIDWFNSK